MTGRTIKLLVSIIVVALLAVWVCSAVCAQGGGGGNAGGRSNRGGFGGQGTGGFGGNAPVVKVGAQGIFVLTAGTLTKFDTKLKEQGTLKFVEPAPPPSADSSDTSTQPRRQMMPRGGVVMIAPNSDAAKEKVLVVYGTDFFSIDAASFKVAAKCKLPDPEPPAGAPAAGAPGGGMGGRMMGGFFGTPTLELNGNTVYVIRGSQMVAINIDDATVVGKATLPQQAPMAPANPGN